MNRPYDFQFRTGYQALCDICNQNGHPAYFGITDDQRLCAIIDDRIAVYNDGNGVRIDCKNSSENDRKIVHDIGDVVSRLNKFGYAFPI